ncbi:unnamed protein product [Pylaiella littoralis]
MTYTQIFTESIKSLPFVKKQFSPRNIRTTQELTYEECEQYLPLRDGDVVYCPSVYDGDSARFTWIDSSGNKVRSLCRIHGIDTPEMRTSSEKEKELAIKAKERLSGVVMGKFVTVRNPGHEKYSRVLCDIEIDEIKSVSKYMLDDPEICLTRLQTYKLRKEHMVKVLEHEVELLESKAKFIRDKLSGDIVIENVKFEEVMSRLESMGFPKLGKSFDDSDKSFGYLTSMNMFDVTEERVSKLLETVESKNRQLVTLKVTKPEDMWLSELAVLEKAL